MGINTNARFYRRKYVNQIDCLIFSARRNSWKVNQKVGKVKMKMIRLATVAALTATILTGGVQAFAEEVGRGTTDNTVSFIADEDGDEDIDIIVPGPEAPEPIDPIDPIDPDQGGSGPLRLLYVPQTFDFDTQTISVSDRSYAMVAELYSVNEGQGVIPHDSFAQVVDTRGSHEGWTLSVDLSDFQSDQDTLTGAAIEFINGEVDYESNLPNSTPSTPAGGVMVNAGGDTRMILSAEDGQGAGRTSVFWGDEDLAETGMNENIRLHVPGTTSQSARAYQAQLTWTLSSIVSDNGETVGE